MMCENACMSCKVIHYIHNNLTLFQIHQYLPLNTMPLCYQIIPLFKWRFSSQSVMCPSKCGGLISSNTDSFLENFNNPAIRQDQLATLESPFSECNIEQAISSLQSQKTPGPDGLTCELYKAFIDANFNSHYNLSNQQTKTLGNLNSTDQLAQ